MRTRLTIPKAAHMLTDVDVEFANYGNAIEMTAESTDGKRMTVVLGASQARVFRDALDQVLEVNGSGVRGEDGLSEAIGRILWDNLDPEDNSAAGINDLRDKIVGVFRKRGLVRR